MGLAARFCKQFAVYWPPGQPDSYGSPTFGEPVQIRCRWDDESTTVQGPTDAKLSNNTMVLALYDVEPGGWLWLGLLADVQLRPQDNPKARLISTVGRYPTLSATEIIKLAQI